MLSVNLYTRVFLGEAMVLSELLLRDQIGLQEHGWELELRLVLLPFPSLVSW